jgi:hypothetical protein
MPKKKTTKKNPAKEYPPGTDEAFWERHERSCQSKIRKDAIRDDVQGMMATLVEKYSSDEFDARKDIAWYFEQFGKDLRSTVDREKARARSE